jgi:hypothetical protein
LAVAAGGRDHQAVAGRLCEQQHRVLEAKHALHGPEHDVEDLVEVERGGDLGGDLLDDADVVGALGEIEVEAVYRLLAPGDLLAERA